MPLVTLLYFASTSELAGTSREQRTVPDGTTAGTLKDWMAHEHPALKPALASCRIAVNREFALPAHALADGDEVALIPPVSGG